MIKNIINEIINDLIIEAADRLEFLKKMFVDIDPATFHLLATNDPTAKIVNDVIVKAGIYTQWMLNKYRTLDTAAKSRIEEDAYKIKDNLTLYHKHKHRLNQTRRDINNIDSFSKLAQIAVSLYNTQKDEEEAESKSNDLRVIYEDDRISLKQPMTQEASIKHYHYPKTSWCTADSRPQYNRFNYYHSQGPLYVIQDKTVKSDDSDDFGAYFQLHFETEQYMDADDNPVSLADIFKSYPIIPYVLFDDVLYSNRPEDVKMPVLITINFDKFIKTHSEYIEQYKKQISCEKGNYYIIGKLYKAGIITEFNCSRIYFKDNRVYYKYPIEDIIETVYMNSENILDLLNGTSVDILDVIDNNTLSFREILTHMTISSTSILKIKDVMEQEGYEGELSNAIENLKNNEDEYPKTVDFIVSVYNNLYESLIYKDIKHSIVNEMDKWFEYQKLEFLDDENVVLSQNSKQFYEDVEQVYTSNNNSNYEEKYNLLYYLKKHLEIHSDNKRKYINTNYLNDINVYVSSREFNDAIHAS